MRTLVILATLTIVLGMPLAAADPLLPGLPDLGDGPEPTGCRPYCENEPGPEPSACRPYCDAWWP